MAGSTTCFTNTYFLYKTYTTDICQWVFTAAGVPIEADQSNLGVGPKPPAPPTQGRPKGKARKLAKAQAASASTQQTPPQTVSEVRIFIKRLVDVAQKAACMPDKVSNVPKMILSKLKKVIELRRQYLALYSVRPSDPKTPDANLSAKDQAHAHFVRGLEHVLRILQPDSPSHPNDTEAHLKDVPMASATPPSPRDNRFNVLDIENMADDEDRTPQTSTAGSKPQPKADLCDDTAFEELMFMVFCLFNDMHRLKIVLRDHWEQYKAGSINLETVALMTELSITAVRSIEQGLIAILMGSQTLPREFGYAELGVVMLNTLSAARLGDTRPNNSSLHDPWQPAVADVVEFTFLPVYSILETLMTSYKPDQIPWTIPGNLGVYDRHADRCKMTPKEIMFQDRIILIELFTDFCALEYSNASDEFHDEFTKGIRKLWSPSPIVPVWLVFASDCFLSTHAILGDDIARPFEELQNAALRADYSFTRFFESRQGQPSFELWPDSNTQSLRDLQTSLIRSSILGDIARKIKMECKKSTRHIDDIIDAGPPHHFLKSHPILSGLLLLRLRTIFKDTGCTIADAWGTTIYTLHAYNALRQSGALDVVWPEMEWLTSQYDTQKLFAGDLPTTPEQCFTRFNLLMGTSLSNFAPNGRRAKTSGRVRPAGQGPRDWDWAVKSAESKVLTDWAQNDDAARCPDLTSRLLSRLMALNQASVSPEKLRIVVGGQILSFKENVEKEMIYLKRDFLDLHLRCANLLRALRRELDGCLTQLVGPNYIENDNQLSMMVGYILLINSKDEQTLQKIYKKRPSSNFCSDVIETAARVMKQSILANPSSEV